MAIDLKSYEIQQAFDYDYCFHTFVSHKDRLESSLVPLKKSQTEQIFHTADLIIKEKSSDKTKTYPISHTFSALI